MPNNKVMDYLSTAAKVGKTLLLPVANLTVTALNSKELTGIPSDPNSPNDDLQPLASTIVPLVSAFNFVLCTGEFVAAMTDIITNGIWSQVPASIQNTLILSAGFTALFATGSVIHFANDSIIGGGVCAGGSMLMANMGTQWALFSAKKYQPVVSEPADEATNLLTPNQSPV